MTVELDQSVRWATELTRVWNSLSRWRPWMAGSFIFCEARAFRELGGFSRELFVAEDIDFSKRLNQLSKMRRQQVIILHSHPLQNLSAKDSSLFLARAPPIPAPKFPWIGENVQKSQSLHGLVRRTPLEETD